MILMILSKSFANLQRLFKICCRKVHWDCITWDISRAYLGYTSGISWTFLEHILNRSWTDLGYITGIPWVYLRHNLGWLSRLVVKIVVKIVVIASTSASSVSIFGIFDLQSGCDLDSIRNSWDVRMQNHSVL